MRQSRVSRGGWGAYTELHGCTRAFTAVFGLGPPVYRTVAWCIAHTLSELPYVLPYGLF